jgi:hypothetical protein
MLSSNGGVSKADCQCYGVIALYLRELEKIMYKVLASHTKLVC